MISDFEEVREDSKVIDESMTVDRIIAQGWAPCRVVDVRWRWQGQPLNIAHRLGLLAIVVPDRQHLAILWNTDESGVNATLYVISGDRQQQVKVSDQLLINGKVEPGVYSWFEYFPHDSPSIFTCMFTRQRDQAMFRVDIDAARGTVIAVLPSR
ncbi:hypothetical protein [Pseudomonas bohemica]|uniref:hypothetical protein n=1 Tax=Pseudomonas bohemica TaxID=2044872 RepID=UPI000DA602A9|nr:hypothetical protein [Pseudomonas bohemica]